MELLDNTKVGFINLEKHQTKDTKDQHVNGSLTVIWRDWDNIIENHIKMIYISSVNNDELKGPHLHTKRTSYFTCIDGKVVFIIKDLNGKYTEIICSSDEPKLVCVPKGFPSAHINMSDKISRVLVLTDIAWKPNDNEMKNIDYEDYDWSKWK